MSQQHEGILPSSPLEASITTAERFNEALQSLCNGKSAPAVTRRLKEFPQILLQAGLVPALTFYASKLDADKKWRILRNVLAALAGGQVEEIICDDVKGEGEGYPHALAILLAYTAGQAGCDIGALMSTDIAVVKASFLKCIDLIRSKGMKLERLTLAYANEVKKLFTALYPST